MRARSVDDASLTTTANHTHQLFTLSTTHITHITPGEKPLSACAGVYISTLSNQNIYNSMAEQQDGELQRSWPVRSVDTDAERHSAFIVSRCALCSPQ